MLTLLLGYQRETPQDEAEGDLFGGIGVAPDFLCDCGVVVIAHDDTVFAPCKNDPCGEPEVKCAKDQGCGCGDGEYEVGHCGLSSVGGAQKKAGDLPRLFVGFGLVIPGCQRATEAS